MRSCLFRLVINNGYVWLYTNKNCISYIYPGSRRGDYVSRRTLYGRRPVPMVTYSDLFQFVIMLCAVITLVLYFTHKK